jgi:hypothetical protein
MQDIYNKIIQNGGITISKDLQEYTGIGYAVAVSKETEIIISESQFIPDYITKVLAQYDAYLNNDRVYLGVWKDQGKVYFDISEVIDDKTQAIEIAKKRDQLAIFDFNTFDSIPVK